MRLYKLGFIGDAWDAGDAPGETFFKKFPPNPLPKLLGQKMNEAFFCPFKGKFP